MRRKDVVHTTVDQLIHETLLYKKVKIFQDKPADKVTQLIKESNMTLDLEQLTDLPAEQLRIIIDDPNSEESQAILNPPPPPPNPSCSIM